LANPTPSASLGEVPPGLQWLANALLSALPFVQRILPLLDGNMGTAVSNALTQHPQPHPPPPPVSLEPLEDSLAELQTQHRDLRNQIVEQNTSLKRVEDQLEMVREATDRNTLEQQELLEDLKSIGAKVTTFAFFALALLAVSILINVILYLHIRRVLP
jgi:tRNA/tmRNA/rRNA uracil-C5-methylase (TrmA/RlmC/RlmD family)